MKKIKLHTNCQKTLWKKSYLPRPRCRREHNIKRDSKDQDVEVCTGGSSHISSGTLVFIKCRPLFDWPRHNQNQILFSLQLHESTISVNYGVPVDDNESI